MWVMCLLSSWSCKHLILLVYQSTFCWWLDLHDRWSHDSLFSLLADIEVVIPSMHYMCPNIQRNPHPKPCLLDQAHVIGNCLYRPWMTIKQWREIIGRTRALCFICSVFVHIKPCDATTPTCHLLPAGTGIACSTAIASTSSPSLCWWRHSFLPWPTAGARRIAWCGRTLGVGVGTSLGTAVSHGITMNHPVFFRQKMWVSCWFMMKPSFSSTRKSWETHGNLGFSALHAAGESMEPAPFRSWWCTSVAGFALCSASNWVWPLPLSLNMV